MLVHQRFRFRNILLFSAGQIAFLCLWAMIALGVYRHLGFKWVAVPWLPMSLVGTALAFYVGFKNNAAYGRMWEARKIWGAIVNSSRSWGVMCKHFVNSEVDKKGYEDIHQRLLYRHVAWLYVLRHQLLAPKSWEHYSSHPRLQNVSNTRARLKLAFPDEPPEEILGPLLSEEEQQYVLEAQNRATRLLDLQSEDLAACKKKGLLSEFEHMELQKLITDFYTQQGKCERIKNFPFPRLYASASYWFVLIFLFFLPFSMIRPFFDMGEDMLWTMIPFSAIVGWVFLVMETVGDYSENPFEGLANDIPMKSLCRTIEIDLRQMLGEDDLPPKIEANSGILM